jgi:hypothetical protein
MQYAIPDHDIAVQCRTLPICKRVKCSSRRNKDPVNTMLLLVRSLFKWVSFGRPFHHFSRMALICLGDLPLSQSLILLHRLWWTRRRPAKSSLTSRPSIWSVFVLDDVGLVTTPSARTPELHSSLSSQIQSALSRLQRSISSSYSLIALP